MTIPSASHKTCRILIQVLTSEAVAVDQVLLHLEPGLLLLEQDVFGELPHSARPAALFAGKLTGPDGVGLGVCRRRAQTRQVQTAGGRCFAAWEGKRR